MKAGAMEQGRWFEAEEGTPQGAVISPILANLYLHYALDLWVEQWRRREARGDVIIVRYADDGAPRAQRAEEGPMCVTA
jgi:retron-type reverse transcriptase